ncbi:uncharacterized protein [Narcine bancroftii]|uniref:uncharacterized protein n=1 Tax=Narcine bancroftii TaxID=1343680 RepID=UPI003831CB44
MDTAQDARGKTLPTVKNIYRDQRAAAIVKDPHHPAHILFSLLPSGKSNHDTAGQDTLEKETGEGSERKLEKSTLMLSGWRMPSFYYLEEFEEIQDITKVSCKFLQCPVERILPGTEAPLHRTGRDYEEFGTRPATSREPVSNPSRKAASILKDHPPPHHPSRALFTLPPSRKEFQEPEDELSAAQGQLLPLRHLIPERTMNHRDRHHLFIFKKFMNCNFYSNFVPCSAQHHCCKTINVIKIKLFR